MGDEWRYQVCADLLLQAEDDEILNEENPETAVFNEAEQIIRNTESIPILPRAQQGFWVVCIDMWQMFAPWVSAVLIGVCTACSGMVIASGRRKKIQILQIFSSFLMMICARFSYFSFQIHFFFNFFRFLGSDFFSDFRFGYCSGLPFGTDRFTCCGGKENFDVVNERCIPGETASGQRWDNVEWVPWERIFFNSSSYPGYAVSFFVYVLTSVVLALLAAKLVVEFGQAAKGSGIPEVKSAFCGFHLPFAFVPRTLLIKCITLAMVVGAGMSLGKEGPLVHIGSCWAFLAVYAFPTVLKSLGMPSHELLCVGSAAGVATAFEAPLGGALFAIEEVADGSLSKRALLLSFTSAFSAAFTLKYFKETGGRRMSLFDVSYREDTNWSSWEVLPFAFLGICGGVFGSMFIDLNLRVHSARIAHFGKIWWLPRWLKNKITDPRSLPVVEVGFIALVTALMNFPTHQLLRMLPSEAIHALFESCATGNVGQHSEHLGLCAKTSDSDYNLGRGVFAALFGAALIKLLQMIVTFGAMCPAGLFIPSLYIGACFGRGIGHAMLLLDRNITLTTNSMIEPGIYAMVGAAGMLAGVTRMTVSLVVIMFELTAGSASFIIPFMISVLAAKWSGDTFTESVYAEHAFLQGFTVNSDGCPLSSGGSQIDGRVSDLVLPARNPLRLESYVPIRTLLTLLETSGVESNGYVMGECVPVLNNEDKPIGFINVDALRVFLERTEDIGQLCSFSHDALSNDDRLLDIGGFIKQGPVVSAETYLKIAYGVFLRQPVNGVIVRFRRFGIGSDSLPKYGVLSRRTLLTHLLQKQPYDVHAFDPDGENIVNTTPATTAPFDTSVSVISRIANWFGRRNSRVYDSAVPLAQNNEQEMENFSVIQ